jgi:isochorismate hydrolase
MQAGRKIIRIQPSTAVFLECDVQSKLAKHIKGFEQVANNSARLAHAAKVFDIPVISTAQVNFGPIDESITA